MSVPDSDLDEFARWCRQWASTGSDGDIRPNHVQRARRCGFNRACALLEALQARGDLKRIPGPLLAWRPAQKPTQGQEHQLSLSEQEREALAEGLDFALLFMPPYENEDENRLRATLRSIRERLRRKT